MKPILNIADAETTVSGNGELFAASHGFLSKPLGGEKIGATVTRVDPGQRGVPVPTITTGAKSTSTS